MKKFVLTALAVLTGGALQALPVMNIADASLYTNNWWWGDSCCDPCDPCGSWCDWMDLRLGFYGDYVFNRHLETRVSGSEGGDIQDTTIMTNAGLIVLNLCDWIDVFGTVGVSNFRIRTENSVWGVGGGNGTAVMSELDFSPAMSYSGGLRATFWQCDCFYVGAEAQYFYSNPELNWYLPYDSGVLTYFNTDRKKGYQEWQVAVGAAYKFVNCADFEFVPYFAVQVAGGQWDLSNFSFVDANGTPSETVTLRKLQPKKTVGWTLGMSAILCDLIGVTVEGRWANEKALHVNGQLSF
ncbi:MAG: hypothetical protein H7A36_06575 [Chlamydiales bacterium]|nr:hypothetical protein [Chlamydiales bacterium]